MAPAGPACRAFLDGPWRLLCHTDPLPGSTRTLEHGARVFAAAMVRLGSSHARRSLGRSPVLLGTKSRVSGRDPRAPWRGVDTSFDRHPAVDQTVARQPAACKSH